MTSIDDPWDELQRLSDEVSAAWKSDKSALEVLMEDRRDNMTTDTCKHKLVLDGALSIVEEWDNPYEFQLDGEGLAELLIKGFGLGPDENAADFDNMRMLIEYGPFNFGKIRITIERLEDAEGRCIG